MATLNELQKSCQIDASKIKVITKENGKDVVRGYQDLSKSELTNGFCDWDELGATTKDEELQAKAEVMKSAYWAAIMLRYWYKMFEWKLNSRSLGLPDSDYFDWLNDSLRDAFCYRSWRKKRRRFPKDPNSDWIDNPQYYEDENAADMSINKFLAARRGKEYQAANKDKRRANYQSLSVDETFDEDGYSILDREGLSTNGKGYNGIKGLINLFLDQHKELSAVIIDSIAYGDSIKDKKQKVEVETTNLEGEKETESYTKYSYDFDARKLVKFLNSINEEYFKDYFVKEYHLTDYEPVLTKLKSLNNNKLYKEIEKTIMMLKQNTSLAAFLA